MNWYLLTQILQDSLIKIRKDVAGKKGGSENLLEV